MPRSLGPAAAAAAAATFTAAVVRRMETDYSATETFRPMTVALMYGAYAANGAAFAWAAARGSWPLPLPERAARFAGTTLAAAGATLSLAGAGRFSSVTQLSGIEPGSLITGGLYRYTRNPQYLGLVAGLAGIAIAARSGLAGAVVAGAWAAFNRWLPSEERHLERVFGDEYRSYAARTRRWL